jgi:acetolactate synthase-1/2/3 large subunit
MNVATNIARWLDEKGVTDVFGVIGSGNAALWDAIARHEKAKITCFHHEQAAAQAAVFYQRVSGKHAAVLVTTGAGSSNVVTGILCAWMDSVPLLVLAGNEPTAFLKQQVRAKGAQGYDFVETVERITKLSIRLYPTTLAYLPAIVDNAWATMLKPRQGPVVLEIPADVQNMEVK